MGCAEDFTEVRPEVAVLPTSRDCNQVQILFGSSSAFDLQVAVSAHLSRHSGKGATEAHASATRVHDPASNALLTLALSRVPQGVMHAREQDLVTCLCFAVLVTAARSLPSSANFLHTQCDGHRRVYQPLVDNELAAYRDGLLVNDILKLDGPSDPIALLYNQTWMARQTPALNMAAIWIPLLKELARKVVLPDLVLAGNVW